MSKDYLAGIIVGAVIMLSGMSLGFWAGYHKHETDSMRVISQWMEKMQRNQIVK